MKEDLKNTLINFRGESLFNATGKLLEQLKIKFTPQSATPLDFQDLYEDMTANNMPNGLLEVANKLTDIYLLGPVDDESLRGKVSDFKLGKDSPAKYDTMLIFAADMRPDVKLTRTEIATLTRGFNRMSPQNPITLILREGNLLTLSSCERTQYKNSKRQGEKLGRVSMLKDINLSNPHRGHIDILESLGDEAYPNFDKLYTHWLKVFSSELLTQKFYKELSEWYAWVIGSGEVKFPNNINTEEDDMKYNHEAVIRLITRLIFVWFLKQKDLIPEEFFDENAIRENFIENFNPHSKDSLLYDPKDSKYYRLLLQNLFFAMLNRPIIDEETGEIRRFRKEGSYHGNNEDFNINNLFRYESEFKEGGAKRLLEIANSKVPFLNGGLFECLDHKDKDDPLCGIYYDGFTENDKARKQLSFPDYFFFGNEKGKDIDLSKWYDDKKKVHSNVRGLIDILKNYNFTVEENTPLDQEVSLDPELLGKVFENLLASYNPETNTTARKQTGSFYTPRPIVRYMVDESLIAHLKKACPTVSEKRLRDLMDYSQEEFVATDEEREKLLKELYNTKALDPACGSGAFPMGLLQQMVLVLRKLDPNNNLWREHITNLALKKDKEAYLDNNEEESNKIRADIEKAFNRSINDPDYARKLYLIENCIFGVDIQPIATQISRLRFFISLIVDQKPTNDPNDNFGIRPLPNLESKFVAANTLIPLEKPEQKEDNNIFLDEYKKLKKKLEEANHKLFRAKSNKEKRKLRRDITKYRKQIAEELISNEAIKGCSVENLASWDMFDQNAAASFFDSEWMFGIEKGFDIVIGNPPYIQLQKSIGEKGIDKKGKEYDMKLGDRYIDCKYETFDKSGDIYCLFYERGNKLVKEGGHVVYITSNKWMRAGYGKELRNYFSQKTNPQVLIDFGGIQVFESATVDTNILLFSKGENLGKTMAVVIGKDNKIGINNLSDFVQQNASEISFNTSDNWVILSPIEQKIKRKIETVGTPLKDWDIQINYGIKTGFNDAFIISTEKRNEILNNCKDEDERKKTCELIRPILRGRDIKKYGYNWAGLWLINTHNGVKGKIQRIHIENYPTLKTYLDQYWDKISIRSDKGDTPYNLRNCAYLDEFNKPKIIYMEIQNKNKDFPCFSFDATNKIILNTGYILTGEINEITYILGILNSIIGKLLSNFYVVNLGESGQRMLAQYVENFPIIKFNKYEHSNIIEIVNSLCSNYSNKELEHRLNQLIYNMYKFDPEEIKFIESNY